MSSAVVEAVGLSVQVALCSSLCVVPIALGLSSIVSGLRPFWATLWEVVLSLPLALPPIVTGYLLLSFLGSKSAIGSFLEANFGIALPFSFVGAVVAASVVSFPLSFRILRAGILGLDPKWMQAAQTLGVGPFRSFIWIVIPLLWPSLLGAWMVAFVRAFGEFGATIVFAGNIEGQTRTLAIAIWSMLQEPDKESSVLLLIGISVGICGLALWVSEVWLKRVNERYFSGNLRKS